MFGFLKRRKTLPPKTKEEAAYESGLANQLHSLMAPSFPNDQHEALQIAIDTYIGEQGDSARLQGSTLQQSNQAETDAKNAALQRENETLNNGYRLSMADFTEIMIPIIGKFNFFPDPDGITFRGTKICDALFRISSKDYRIHVDAKDELLGCCDTDAVASVMQCLRSNYERLRCCAMANHEFVVAIENRHACPICNDMNGRRLSVSELLNHYKQGTIGFPHEIPHDDVAAWCCGPSFDNGPSKHLTSSGDPEFDAWMDAVLQRQ